VSLSSLPVKLSPVFFQHADRGRPGFASSVLIFLTLAGVAAGMTMLFLGMRGVMEVGGSCGSGGPYVYVRPCPSGVPLAMMGGIWGGVVAFLAYLYLALRYGVPSWIWLAWPALFLSLGWNFLEFGFDSPGGGGLEWGWIVCGVLFAFMGGGPLLLFARPILRGILPLPKRNSGRLYEPPPRRDPVSLVEPLFDPQPADARHDEAAHLVSALSALANETHASLQTAADPTATTQSDDGESHTVAALERLAALRRAGSLTEEEFAAAKRRVLEDGS